MTSREDALYARAERILDGRALGLGMPILRRLALRAYVPAMLSLANRESETGSASEAGRISRAASPLGRMYRAYRQNECNAAQNLAMTYFNMGDLEGYRHWILRAARMGDTESAAEAKRFEKRFPHGLARRLRRLRPVRRDGS